MTAAATAKIWNEFNLRETGILPVGSLPWGSHVCLFYESPDDLIEANARFLRAGLEAGEFCLWVIPDELHRDTALAGLRARVDGLDDYLASGAIELLPAGIWYHRGEVFDLGRYANDLQAKLDAALAQGFAGMRGSGNAWWMESGIWSTFRQYEESLDEFLSGLPMVILCTYQLRDSWAADLHDVARFHQFSIILRKGRWTLLQTPELAAAARARPAGPATDILPGAFAGSDRLSPRERATLAEIARGKSSKEAARALGISPRTVEFHRANLMRKLGAANLAELLGIVHGAR